jgi:hypothetical protein
VIHSRLVEGLRPDNPLAQAPYLAAPFSLSTASGMAALNAEVTRQAAGPGYIKDHIVPLACGGPDAVSNLQWQTIRDVKAKDKWETKGCTR